MCERVDLGNGNFAIICGGHRARRKTVKLPATESELKAGGWTRVAARRCRLCQRELEFWKTLSGAVSPVELVLQDGKKVYVSHFATCPERDKFRKPKPDVPKSGNLFG